MTAEIRLPEVSRYASLVSAYPEVQAYLLEMQRQLAEQRGDGRPGYRHGGAAGCGVKVFLTASAEGDPPPDAGAGGAGDAGPYAAILRAIQERDWNDTHRDAAPLRQAEDAVLLDTTALDFVQSEDALLHIIRERTGL
ncbi:MAG: (d)CMP kinase [Dysosmobacter welbionis]